ncbi:MAG: hypothetical protein EBS44_08330 [Betaproteobacteria bacterium]|nr:hypothetical protein [Betaproteobacteria bacterium]
MTPEPADNPTSNNNADVITDTSASVWKNHLVKWVFAGVAVLALIGALVSVWTVFKLNGIQEILAKQTSDVSIQAVEARVSAKQAEELARDTAARLAVTDAKLSEVSLQRAQLEDLMQSLSRSRDENLVVDIESAIRLAQQQSQLTGRQLRLTKVAQPRLAPVSRAIVRDIEQIKATPVTDTPTLLIKIDELVRALDNIALLNAVGTSVANNAASKPAHETLSWARAISMSWWEKMLNDLWRNAQGLVRISRIDKPEASLLAPEQSYFVRENLKLRLLNVRLAVLARHFESAQADMNQVTRDLNKYFDVVSGQGPLTLAIAREVLAQSKNTEIPRIDATLAALATAAAGR